MEPSSWKRLLTFPTPSAKPARKVRDDEPAGEMLALQELSLLVVLGLPNHGFEALFSVFL